MQLRSTLASLTLMAVAAAPVVLTTPQAQAAPVPAVAAAKPAAKVTLYKATGAVYVRSGATTSSRPLGVLKKGQAVQAAGKAKGKWQPVKYKGRTGYVSLRYLSVAGKATVARTKATKPRAAKRSSVTSSLPAARNVSMPRGVNGNGMRVANAVRANFPQISSMGGYRAEYGSDHGSGRAVDVMIPNYRANQALGKQIAEYMRANASSLGITYVIWDQHIWSVQRSSEGWRKQGNRGSDNANHRNHVHVSVR